MMLITPSSLAKSGTESGHQRALFAWANYAHWHGIDPANHWAATGKSEQRTSEYPRIPCLAWLHAIPNGGSRGDDERSRMIRGATMKAEGVKSGVSDVFLPFRARAFAGLYIEMKKPAAADKRAGTVSEEQQAFGAYVTSQGFGFVVCYTWEEAAEQLSAYLRHATAM